MNTHFRSSFKRRSSSWPNMLYGSMVYDSPFIHPSCFVLKNIESLVGLYVFDGVNIIPSNYYIESSLFGPSKRNSGVVIRGRDTT